MLDVGCEMSDVIEWRQGEGRHNFDSFKIR